MLEKLLLRGNCDTSFEKIHIIASIVYGGFLLLFVIKVCHEMFGIRDLQNRFNSSYMYPKDCTDPDNFQPFIYHLSEAKHHCGFLSISSFLCYFYAEI
jgi:hypothetical protein